MLVTPKVYYLLRGKFSRRDTSVNPITFLIMTISKFEAVLPHPIKWNVTPSQFPTEGRDKTMTLAIPVDAIDSYIKHLELLKGAKHRHSTGSVYDYEKREKKQVPMVYLSAGGRSGVYGNFGYFNPDRGRCSDLYNK